MTFVKRGLVVCFLLLAFLVPTSSFADDTSPTIEKKSESVGRVTLENEEYPHYHYQLEADIGDGIKDTGDRALHGINNGLWGFNKVIAQFTLFSVEQLMSFDLIGSIVQEAGLMSERIYELMAGTFLSLFVVLVGGSAAYRFFVNQQVGHAIKAIIGALVIMTATFWFYSDTTGNIATLNQWGADLEGIASSANVLMTSEEFDTDEAYSPKEGTAVLQNQLFNLMLKRPYLLMNYGTTKESVVNKEDPNRIDSLLKIKPYTEEGKEQRSKIVTEEVETLDNRQMSPEFSGERFGYLIVTIISSIALAVPVLLLASFKFLLQVWFLALVIFAAVPLVLSLIPSYSETALKHFKKIIGVLLLKGGLVLLIAVITGLVTLLYESVKMTDGIEGYAFVVFLIVLCIWGLVKYRSEIFEVASVGMVQGQQMAERMTYSTANSISEAGGKGTKRLAGMSFKMGQKMGQKARGGDSNGGTPSSDGGTANSPSKSGVTASQGAGKRSDLRNPTAQAKGDSSTAAMVQGKKVGGANQTSEANSKSALRDPQASVVHLNDYKSSKGQGSSEKGKDASASNARASGQQTQNPNRQRSGARNPHSVESQNARDSVNRSSEQTAQSGARNPASNQSKPSQARNASSEQPRQSQARNASSEQPRQSEARNASSEQPKRSEHRNASPEQPKRSEHRNPSSRIERQESESSNRVDSKPSSSPRIERQESGSSNRVDSRPSSSPRVERQESGSSNRVDSKPITQWEAQQQVEARNSQSQDQGKSEHRQPKKARRIKSEGK